MKITRLVFALLVYCSTTFVQSMYLGLLRREAQEAKIRKENYLSKIRLLLDAILDNNILEVEHLLEEVKPDLNDGPLADYRGEEMFTGQPLRIAIEHGLTSIVKELLDKGANPNIRYFHHVRPEQQDESPIIIAAGQGDVDIAQLLLDYGANLEARDESEDNPLIEAARAGHLEMVKWLIEHGVNINSKNKSNYSALRVAADHGHLKIVEELVHNPDISQEDVQRVILFEKRKLPVDATSEMLEILESKPLLSKSAAKRE